MQSSSANTFVAKDHLRLTSKIVKAVKLVKPTKRAQDMLPQRLPELVLTQADSIASPFEIALSDSIELPMQQSTEWQLRYPPGGSTHPSYPWPTADPRLVFQTHYVPLANGVPNVSHVPRLALPMGWRQTCWSGLHPVVFDPYQQAFKLTPVGPLPLTSEEVQQGGLQQYVPGGRLHPEYGLLPNLSSLGNGSDTEIFNFEGINWTLPWAHIEGGFDYDNAAERPVVGNSIAPSMQSPAVSNAFKVRHHYVEGRDCPDDVIDLEEAWRWLTNWDPDSETPFQITPGKSWRGSGIPLSGRTTKQPIASLMALTMTDKDPSVEHYLVKQTRSAFCPLKSVATPVHVDILLLGDIEFTIVELLVFFPFHYQWNGAASRLIQAGMTPSDVANFVNMARKLPAGSLCVASTVSSYLYRNRHEDVSGMRTGTSINGITCYTSEHWENTVWEKTDYPLLGLAVGLDSLPSGPDAGPLTSLIHWCRLHQRHTVMLSEAPRLLKEAGIESLIDPGESKCPDQEAVARHGEAMKKDRLRVLKELRDLKEERELAAASEKSSKKRKMQ